MTKKNIFLIVAVVVTLFSANLAYAQPQGFDRSFTVGLNGGDFSSLEQALGSINDSSASRQIQLVLAPGVHALNGAVSIGPNMHLLGAGRGVTIVAGNVNGALVTIDDEGARSTMTDMTIINREDVNAPISEVITLLVTDGARLELDNIEIVVQTFGADAIATLVENFSTLTARDSMIRAVGDGTSNSGTALQNTAARIIVDDSRIVTSAFNFANALRSNGEINSITEIRDSVIASTGVSDSNGLLYEGFESGVVSLHGSKVTAIATDGIASGINFPATGSEFGLAISFTRIIGDTVGLAASGPGTVSLRHSTVINGVSSDGSPSLVCTLTDNGPPADILPRNCLLRDSEE